MIFMVVLKISDDKDCNTKESIPERRSAFFLRKTMLDKISPKDYFKSKILLFINY